MTHLRIEQTTGSIEEVSMSIISKLYEIAHAGLDASSNLQGRLHSPVGIRSQIQELTTTYPNLYINVDDYAIEFEDPKMVTYLNSIGVGSNGIVTEAQAAAATIVANSPNTEVTKFNELRYFTSITQSRGGWNSGSDGCARFLIWTALEEVDISNFTSLGHVGGYGYGDTFMGCTSLKKVIASDKLTKLGFYAFRDCTNLEHITGLSGTIQVSSAAFQNCSKLSDEDIADVEFEPAYNGTTLMGGEAFAGTNFTEITLSSNTIVLPSKIFYGCSNLETVNGLGSNITNYCAQCFQGCVKFTGPSNFTNVTEIGNSAFQNTKITSVTLDNDVTLGNDVFAECNSLLSVAMPEQTAIGAGAFGYDTNLNTVSMPSVQTIHGWAFNNCPNLETVTMPSSITLTAGERNHFNNCQKLLFPTPLTINYQDTNTRPIYSFASCKKLKKVILGQNVQHIGKCMFYECEDLEEIQNTNKIVYLGDHCFYKTKLTGTLNLPNCIGFSAGYYAGEANQGMGPFHTCGLSKIILGDFDLAQVAWHTQGVGRSLFYNMPNLETVDFKSITHMPNFNDNSSFEHTALFSYCPSMKRFILRSTTVPPISNSNTTLDIRHFGGSNVTIYVPYSAINDYKTDSDWSSVASYMGPIFTDKTFRNYEFENCDYPGIMIEGNTTSISVGCFRNSTNLKDVVFSDNVASINTLAFSGCSNLLLDKIPDSVTTLSSNCFSGCSKITVNSSNNVTDMRGGVFMNCTSITSFTIKSKCAVEGASFFNGCTNLETVTFEPGDGPDIIFNNESSYSAGAFVNTKITTLDFPERLSTLGNASLNCSTLRTLIIRKTTVPNTGTLSLNEHVQIYVPDASVQLYKDTWTGLASRIHGISELPS